MLVFEGKGESEYPEKNISEQSREPTTNSTQIWRLCRDLSSSHISERRAPSLLRHPLLSITNEGQYFRIREVILSKSPYRVQNFKWMLFTGWCLGGFLVGGFLVGLAFLGLLFLHLFLFLFFPLHFFLFLFLSGFLFFFFFGLSSASSPSSAACSSTGPNRFPAFFSLISLISGFVISNLQTSPLAEGRL